MVTGVSVREQALGLSMYGAIFFFNVTLSESIIRTPNYVVAETSSHSSVISDLLTSALPPPSLACHKHSVKCFELT